MPAVFGQPGGKLPLFGDDGRLLKWDIATETIVESIDDLSGWVAWVACSESGDVVAARTDIGEAVMRAKREFRSQVLVQTYNLLGDPAIPVAAPSRNLELELEPDPDGRGATLRAKMPTENGSYTVLADWVGTDGAVLRQDRLESGGGRFSLRLETEDVDGREKLDGVRVYVWDEDQRVDGIGWAESPVAETAAATIEQTVADEKSAARSTTSKGES